MPPGSGQGDIMTLDVSIIAKLARVGLTVMRPDADPPVVETPLFIPRVAAGLPAPADDTVDECLDLNAHCMPNPAMNFLLRVSGQSMKDAGIHNGDILVVDRGIPAKSGHIMIAVLDGKLTVKRMTRTGQVVQLVPENPDYPAIIVHSGQDFRVWGVVTFVVHRV